MPDKAWKAFERRIAKSLGTERSPLSGIYGHITSSDTLHPDLYVECKYRNRLPVGRWYEETDEKAMDEDKFPVLALKEKGYHTTIAVISWHSFLKLWEAYAKSKGVTHD